MIMKIFSLENDMIFTEEYINVLQIQDKKLFTNVINSLNDNINNIEDTKERIIILDNDTEIKIEKEVLMIIDVFNIDFNQKKIQNALYNKIEKIYKQEFERMSEFQNVFQKLQLNVLDVFNEFPFEFNYKESIGIQEYLKLLGLKISNNKEKIIDTIFSLIDVVEYLSIAKLLIFVNIKLYLGNDEIQEVYKYAMYKKVNILLIETGEEKELEVSGVFVAVGMKPVTDIFKDYVELDKTGYIKAGEDCKTSSEGIFAAGDIRTKPLRQVVTAVADGATAVQSVERYLHSR